MSSRIPVYPFDSQRLIGTTTEINPTSAKANLPNAGHSDGAWRHGHRLGEGEVGEFVLLECGENAVFGRILGVKLPERERLSVDPRLGTEMKNHPIGTIQLLSSINVVTGEVLGGIVAFPRVGTSVYSAHPEIIKWIAEASSHGRTTPSLRLNIATLSSPFSPAISLTPERLFGRHSGVLGATGGGKSWTLARLIEELAGFPSKVLLVDATGEFYPLGDIAKHVHLGIGTPEPATSTEVVLPYSKLTEADLFALFRPSPQTQAPKLRQAMRSLKLARLEPSLATSGLLQKSTKKKKPFEDGYKKHVATIEGPLTDFEIIHLTKQINEECIWQDGGYKDSPDPSSFGKANEQERGYCVSLVTRIDDMTQAKELACIFQPQKKESLFDSLDKFLADPTQRVLRVSMKYVPFAHDARDIVANAIGRHLLSQAREGKFKNRPLVVFVDEAHNFLNKTLTDEYTRFPLDSFELIAKEGRKFSLTLCLSTQRPRDIPEAVLSQLGTLIVHRLTNNSDREVVERASGDIDKSAAAFLPTLGPGEAVLIGVDFPIPLTIKIAQPIRKPDSKGPDYQGLWRDPKK
jgi:hypothetical protein